MLIKRTLLLCTFAGFLAACDSDSVRVTTDDGAADSDASNVADDEAANGSDANPTGVVGNAGIDSGSGGDSDSDSNGTGSGADDTGEGSGIIGDIGGGARNGAVCVDTPPIGDGWGWDGTQSCRVGDTSVAVTGDSADGTDGTTGASNSNISGGAVGGSGISLLGLLKLEPNSTQADFSRALFGRVNGAFTAEEIQNFFAPTADTCQVTPVDPNASSEPQLNIFEQRLDLVSAGETVVISSSAGTFATLNSSQGSAGPIYRTNVVLNVDRPSGLSVDVPGGEFPAFSAVPISDVPVLQISSPLAGQNVDAFSSFAWNGNETTLSVMEVHTSGVGANNQEIVVGCQLVDDGSFSFPEDVRTQMGNNFDDNWTVYLRVVYTIASDGDSLFVTANSRFGTR